MRFVALFLLPLVSLGCNMAEVHARESSGAVGCAPEDIRIDDGDQGIAGTSWTAWCHGQKYFCSYAGRSAHCARDTSEVASTPAPPKAEPKPKEWKVKGPHWRMRLPGTFETEDESGRYVYHPPGDTETLVFVDVEKFAGDASAYAQAKFEGRTVKKAEVGGQHGVIATEVKVFRKLKRRVSTVVLTSDGDAYALTCADTELDEISDFCKKTFRSFEVDGAD